MLTKIDKHHLYQQDQGTKKQRLHWSKCKKQLRQKLGIPYIPKSVRTRFNDQLDPSLRRYLEWISTNWAEYFTEERVLPTSSSSQWSSTSWLNTHSWSTNWKGWHHHSWQSTVIDSIQACFSAAFVAPRLKLRMVDLRLFAFPWLAFSWILPFPVCTALCAQHADVVSVVFPVVAVEGFCFPSNAPSDAVAVLALDIGRTFPVGRQPI